MGKKSSQPTTTGSELLVDALADSEVDVAFGLPGNSLIASTEYMFRSGKMRFITVRHEQVAAGMAEGYARVTGKPGVCIGGAGPSAANLLIGVANAYRASVPMLALTGNLERSKLGRDALNEWDQMAMFRPITKFSTQVTDPDKLASQVRLALLSSVQGRPGPVHLDFPADVGRARVAPLKRMERLSFEPTRVQARAEDVGRAADIIMSAERPLIIAGGGALSSGAGQRLEKLSNLLSIPVALSGARGIVSEDEPLCFGPVGVWGYAATNHLVESSDMILGLGFRFSDDTTMGWKTVPADAKIVQVDIDPGEIGRQYDVALGIVADVDTFLGQLLGTMKTAPGRGGRGWPKDRLAALRAELRKERESLFGGPFEEEPVDKRVIVRDLMNLARDDAIVTVGTGVHTRYGSRMIVKGPRRFLRSGAFAAMGFAYPAAMGAKVAAPDKQVFCLDGDGDFMMTVQDLETAVREEIHFVTVVFNNLSYAAYKFWPNKRIGVEFGNPDLVKLAESFGAVGTKVTRSRDFRPALQEMMKADKPALIDAVVTPETDLPWY
jgi:acetolactate synthase I/II/III large subunit